MSKCIQTSCDCTGYKEPAQSKNTLLQFRLSCQVCGHQASEHRKLTAVDHFIKSQVALGKRSSCRARILPSEIPLSPVFGRYDLIPIPRDDESCSLPANMQENSIQCTCRGFQLPDLIKLYQKFRTHSLSDVTAKLKEIPCSFCAHPLQAHSSVSSHQAALNQNATPKQDAPPVQNFSVVINRRPPLGAYENLTLQSSSSLPFPPVNSNCMELVAPRSLNGSFLLVSVGKSADSDVLSLVVASQSVNLQGQEVSPEDEVKALSPGPGGNLEDEAARKKARKSQPAAESSTARSRQRRRSMRLAGKKAKEEERKVLKQLKGLKGVGGWLSEVELCEGEGEEEGELNEQELKQVTARTVSFVKSTDCPKSYRTFNLPQELSGIDSIFPVMCALKTSTCQDIAMDTSQDTMDPTTENPPYNSDFSGRSKFVVSVGSKQSNDLFMAVLPWHDGSEQPQGAESEAMEVETRQLTWQLIGGREKGNLQCLSMSETGRTDEALLLAGWSCGSVCVWRATIEDYGLSVMKVVGFECLSQCLALRCSPDNKLLAVGTQLGEVVLCYLPSEDIVVEEQPVLQTLQCSRAPLRCITWSQDARLVAVGACDDAVQVLQCVESSKDKQVTKGSIFQYFRPTEGTRQPKFTHTHTLKGHSSFIADLRFLDNHSLVSLGWDSQLLFWRHLTRQPPCTSSRLKSRGRGRGEEGPEVVEPVGGYKIGPAVVVEFLPLKVRTLMGCGLLVAMENKMGGVTVACYCRQSLC